MSASNGRSTSNGRTGTDALLDAVLDEERRRRADRAGYVRAVVALCTTWVREGRDPGDLAKLLGRPWPPERPLSQHAQWKLAQLVFLGSEAGRGE